MTYEEVSQLLKSPVKFKEYLIKLLKDTDSSKDPDYSDAMEVLRGEGDTTDWECSKCGKEFTVSLEGWSLYFDSEKGTCDE